MEYIEEQFTRNGLLADVAVHSKQASDGLPNVHVHILTTTREIGSNGEFVTMKNNHWNKRERVGEWRKAWADKLNRALEDSGSDTRADHRSYEARGLDKTAQEHLGYEAWHLEQKGTETERGDRNREIRHENAISEIVRGNLQNGQVNDYERGQEPEWERENRVANVLPDPEWTDDPYALQHTHTLRQYMRTTTFRTLQANAELIIRMKAAGRTLMDKAREIGRTVVDRFSRWTERATSVRQSQQRTGGHER